MGINNLLSGAQFTNPGYKIIRADPGLTDGSLAMFDMTHSGGRTGSGVPANGAAIPNLAAEQCADLIGSGAATLDFIFTNTFTAPRAAFERTSVGALYGVVSQTDQSGQVANIELAPEIRSYLTSNTTRAMALFIWADIKRVAASNVNMKDFGVVNATSAATSYLFNGTLANSAGPQRAPYSAPTGWTGSPNANPSLNSGQVFNWGNHPAYNSLNPNDGKSVVLHRLHLVDVAASGMTYAELNAADLVLYNAMHADGGRLDGETTSLDLGDYT